MNNAIMCFAQTAGARHQRGMARSPGSGSSPTRRRLLPQPQRQHAVQSGARLLLAAALAAACAGGLVAPRLLLRARSAAGAAPPRAAAPAPLISGRDACVRKVRDHNPDRGEGEGVADSCLVYAIIRILVDHRCLSFFFPVASSLVFPCLVASSPVDRRIYMRVWRGNLASGRPHHDIGERRAHQIGPRRVARSALRRLRRIAGGLGRRAGLRARAGRFGARKPPARAARSPVGLRCVTGFRLGPRSQRVRVP